MMLSIVQRNHVIIMYFMMLAIFFFMSVGLGYAVLNRYDPTQLNALSDTVFYSNLVERGLDGIVYDPYGRSTRILLPMIAHFFYETLPQLGTWNMTALSMLISTSIFSALSGLFIFILGFNLTKSSCIAIFASLLYLLNYSVTNFYLAGLVDGGFGFSFIFLLYALTNNKWNWIPIIGMVGALIKEVFLPLGSIFILGWMISEWYQTKKVNLKNILYFLAFIGITFSVVTVLKSYALNELVFPWKQVSDVKGETIYTGMFLVLTIVRFLYVFVWLLPLSIPNLSKLPKNWIGAMGAAVFITIILGMWAGISGAGFGRGVFNVAAAGFCIASAITLNNLLETYQKKRSSNHSN